MPPSTELTLPASCFAGNPVSPISPNGHPEAPEVDAMPLSQPGESEVEVPSLSPSHPPAVTSRCRQLPTPVELQDTRLWVNTTPTHQGGNSYQGLQESGKTEGVKGVSNPIVSTSNY